MMKYAGNYPFFEFEGVETYPIANRSNKVKGRDLLAHDQWLARACSRESTDAVAEAIVGAIEGQKPVILMMGAHPIKLGLSPILIEWVKRGVITHLSGNGAVSIHDFELALIGETSEDVPNALAEGTFGMAFETGHYMNQALAWGHEHLLGYGESIARMILQDGYPAALHLEHPELSVLAAAFQKDVPVTIHASLGTDIIDQHPTFSGEAKGGCVGRDFGIFASSVTQLTEGGVILNVGSAVTMPEVLLKAVSMAANVGRAPAGIHAVDFDLRPEAGQSMTDEDAYGYYCRDQKSVVCRIPQAFQGQGTYVQGNFKDTLPSLHLTLAQRLGWIS
ncbi:MAG: GSU2086 family protein [Planctomycetota bacterium]|jgi:hypothetical protein